jgi:hypothetical protein
MGDRLFRAARAAALLLLVAALPMIQQASATTTTRSVQATPFATVTTCKTSATCLDVRNNGTGIAISALANQNIAVLAQVTNVGQFGAAAVYGTDNATAIADYNYGVWGDSINATGVLGQTFALGGQAGVRGAEGSFTLNTNSGVYGFSQLNYAVYGQTDTGVGSYGIANDGNGVDAFNASNSLATLVVTNSNNGPLIHGFGFVRGAYKEVMSLDGHGNLVLAGNLQTGGNPQLTVLTSKGTSAVAYAPKSTASTLEDVGEAQLAGGQSYVRLTPTFATMIDLHSPYLVFITPQGETRGLYVTQKSASGFAVREAAGGRSSVAFDYRIVARSYGSTLQAVASQTGSLQGSMSEIQTLRRGAAGSRRTPVIHHQR